MAISPATATTLAASMSQATARTLAAATIQLYMNLANSGESSIALLGAQAFMAAVKTAFGDSIQAP
jgi:hypothetical protein